MLLGAIVGFVTQRYPRDHTASSASRAIGVVVLAAWLMPVGVFGQAPSTSPADPLAVFAFRGRDLGGVDRGSTWQGHSQARVSRLCSACIREIG